MGARLYEQAETAAAAIDIPLELLSKSEPWLAAITVEQMNLSRIGFNPAFGIEMHYSSRAIADGKEILGFESFEEQIGFLDGLSIEAQRELLVQTLTEGAGIRSLMDEVIAAWRRGDITYLEDSLLDEIEQYPELSETLVEARNRRWVDVIETLLGEQEDYLVIVGALHLVGNTGVPALLDARGIRITQVGAGD